MSVENTTMDLHHVHEEKKDDDKVATTTTVTEEATEEVTADTFAKQFLEDLFTKKIEKPDLSAFEHETLDLNITSKYDNLPEEEDEVAEKVVENAPEPTVGVSTFEVSEPVANHKIEHQHSMKEQDDQHDETMIKHEADLPPEPADVCTFAVETSHAKEKSHTADSFHAEETSHTAEISHQDETIKTDVNNNTNHGENHEHDKMSSFPEPAAHESEFNLKSEEKVEEEVVRPASSVEEMFEVKHNTFAEDEHSQTNGNHNDEADEEEENDTFEEKVSAPKQDSNEIDLEDELDELSFKKIGVAKSLWKSKRSEVKQERDEDERPTFDKFRTIKQNIKKGNTRSLKERFENFGKF